MAFVLLQENIVFIATKRIKEAILWTFFVILLFFDFY